MDITDLVSVLPGVGPKRAENLQELGIATIEDLLTYYPFRYDDIQEKDLSGDSGSGKSYAKRASGFGSSR